MLQAFYIVAHKIGISALMLVSICQVETGLKPINNFNDPHGGSFGVCQLNLNTARSIDPIVDKLALQQPIVNITIAAKYIKQLSKYNEGYEIIASYNAGSARYNEDGSFINQAYVNKVINKMEDNE